jgi:pimeloyl-ACP methyl ester carboxylesterase
LTPAPSLLLVHGAASGAWVWDAWRRHLRELEWQVNVLDLRGHGRSLPSDLTTVTLEDYLADIASVTVQIERAQGVHPIIGGWSMGGLLAQMYAREHPETPALLLFDSIAPVEVTGRAPADVQRKFAGAVLTPETFGIFPEDPARSRETLFDLTDEELTAYLSQASGAEESGIAFRQTLRGISVPADALTMPSLVIGVAGSGLPDEQTESEALAQHLGCEMVAMPGVGHWGVVYHDAAVEQAAPAVDAWLRRTLPV